MPRKNTLNRTKPVTPPSETPKKKVAIYSRVSTAGQGDSGLSLEHQLSRCQNYCVSKDWQIVNTYSDVKSAKDLERPEFIRMIEDAKGKRFDIILAHKLDRISRVPKDFYNLFELLQNIGVEICTVEDNFDTTTPQGRVFLGILLQFAAFERELGIERTANAMLQNAINGKVGGGYAPLGYERREKNFFVIEAEAEIVKYIFREYASGILPSQICNYLNSKGYRTKKHYRKDGTPVGDRPFSPKTILDVIKNPTYIGVVVYNGKAYEGKHEKIIDEDLYHKANEQVGVNLIQKATGKITKSDAILNGIIRCELCGAAYSIASGTSKSGAKFYYYKCQTVVKRRNPPCNSAAISQSALENIIFDLIKDIADDDKYFKAMQVSYKKQFSDKIVKEIKAKLTSTKQEILTRENELANIISIIKNGKIKKLESLETEIQKLETIIKELIDRKSELESDLKQNKSADTTTRDLRKVYSNFSQIIDQMNAENKKKLVRLLVREIIIKKVKNEKEGHLKISLYKNPPQDLTIVFNESSNSYNIKLRRRGSNPQPSG
jgi:site-specific DNA recombinase